LEVLLELSEVATAEVYVQTASISDTGTVVLEGFATGPEAAYQIRDQLAARKGVLADVTYVKGHTGRDSQFSHQFTLSSQARGWSRERRPGGRR